MPMSIEEKQSGKIFHDKNCIYYNDINHEKTNYKVNHSPSKKGLA